LRRNPEEQGNSKRRTKIKPPGQANCRVKKEDKGGDEGGADGGENEKVVRGGTRKIKEGGEGGRGERIHECLRKLGLEVSRPWTREEKRGREKQGRKKGGST